MPAQAAAARTLDALTSATLKHVREEWWDDSFTDFLSQRLKPRAGNRILDVGCGTGTAELRLSRQRLTQVSLFGLDQIVDRAAVAERAADAHNLRASFAAADACHIPFPDGTFDSTFCVAVLQHIREPGLALREFARVTRPGGRILAVEPDNSARYWFSSMAEGMTAFAAARQFFEAIAKSRGEAAEARVGPQLTALFADAGVEPLEIQVFPVSVSKLGPPEAKLWVARKRAVEAEISWATEPAVRSAGDEFLRAIDAYEKAAASAGPGFVEIQSTLLFAVVGMNQG